MPADTSNIQAMLHHTRSSKGHRDSQRTCVGTELVNLTVTNAASLASLPLKGSQLAVSALTFFRKKKLKPIEHMAHGAQALICLGQILIVSALFFKNEEGCEDKQTTLCKTLTFLDCLYNTILIAGWSYAEVNKEPYDEHSTIQHPSTLGLSLTDDTQPEEIARTTELEGTTVPAV